MGPVAVPRAVPREIVQVSHVAKPYEVPVPRAVHVPAPYKVHPVQEIVETPHVHHATYETHSAQAVVTPIHTPVHAVEEVPVGVAQQVHHVGYQATPVATAVGTVAAPVGAAGVVGYGAGVGAVGYGAGLVAGAPVAAIH